MLASLADGLVRAAGEQSQRLHPGDRVGSSLPWQAPRSLMPESAGSSTFHLQRLQHWVPRLAQQDDQGRVAPGRWGPDARRAAVTDLLVIARRGWCFRVSERLS
jgi:hypothetical protein